MNPTPPQEVIGMLHEVKQKLELPDTDVVWSRYKNVEEALEDINAHIERLLRGDLSKLQDFTVLFLPTASLQEMSLCSGWGEEFLDIAARIDHVIESLRPK